MALPPDQAGQAAAPPAADAGVRPARVADAAAVADVQLRTWQACYGHVLPAAFLQQLADADAEAEARWRDAVAAPPSAEHAVWVAVARGRLVGFAAVVPASDEDLGRGVREISELAVEPESQRQGHGSRLLAAIADDARQRGVAELVAWVFAADPTARRFLEGAGWGADGAFRDLEVGDELVRQERLRTSLG
jgi:GNAT superfamily N-acetyltransferase